MKPWQSRRSLYTYGSGVLAFWGVFILLYAVGWIWNIVKLCEMNVILTGVGAARIAGIFVPFLGPIMGYFV